MNKVVKGVLTVSAIVLSTVVLGAAGYVGYLFGTYYRIGDKALDVDRASQEAEIKVGETYKAMTYNIGFGAYSQDFTFFLDTGYDEQGKPTSGTGSKAKDKDTVLFNVNGAIKTVTDEKPDFVMFQEVDTDGTRSRHVNEDAMIREAFPTYDHTFAENFHSAFLAYPIFDMHGIAKSGLTTVSRFRLSDAMRKEFVVADSLSKIFDLDRCFSYQKAKVDNGKNLYLVNSHMSAYSVPEIREKQVQQINEFLKACKDEGAYVVIGGDWNHDLLVNNPDFSYTKENAPFGEKKKSPDWLSFLFDENGKLPFIEGFSAVGSDNTPTCRNNDIDWQPGKTFVCAVDGFLVSDNVEVVGHRNILTKNGNKGLDGFAYSDHEPALMEFRLK